MTRRQKSKTNTTTLRLTPEQHALLHRLKELDSKLTLPVILSVGLEHYRLMYGLDVNTCEDVNTPDDEFAGSDDVNTSRNVITSGDHVAELLAEPAQVPSAPAPESGAVAYESLDDALSAAAVNTESPTGDDLLMDFMGEHVDDDDWNDLVAMQGKEVQHSALPQPVEQPTPDAYVPVHATVEEPTSDPDPEEAMRVEQIAWIASKFGDDTDKALKLVEKHGLDRALKLVGDLVATGRL